MKPISAITHIVLIAWAAPSVAFAALGGDMDSLQADRARMKASAPVARKAAGYTVHDMTTPAGIAVREYASPAGTVFAVSWKGRSIPDMRQLMGTYFGAYSGAASAKHVGHTHLAIRQEGLVVKSSGHMRSFSGIAYLPSMLPQGVKEEDIN